MVCVCVCVKIQRGENCLQCLHKKTRPRIEIMECCFAHNIEDGRNAFACCCVDAYIVDGKITKCFCDEEK